MIERPLPEEHLVRIIRHEWRVRHVIGRRYISRQCIRTWVRELRRRREERVLMSKRLEQWFITSDAGPFTAPELATLRACGDVYGDDRRPDGRPIRTSAVERFDYENRRVITRSGSVYELGEPKPDYREAMAGHNADTDRLLGESP